MLSGSTAVLLQKRRCGFVYMKELFRKNSMDSLNSTEVLRSYPRVANPSGALVAAAILAFMLGLFAWAHLGHYSRTITAEVQVSDGTAVAAVSLRDADRIEENAVMTIDGREFVITDKRPSEDEAVGEFLLEAAADIPDGSYSAQIEADTFRPLDIF